MQQESRILHLEKTVVSLESKVDTLLQSFDERIANKRLEIYYQKHLEKKYQATHLKGNYGITDIETYHEIIEIKRWDRYKDALGQLLSYTHQNHKRKVVYFFGNKPKNIDNIVGLFQKYDITIYHLSSNSDGVITDDEIHFTLHNDPFYKWLVDNVKYEENSLLKLKCAVNACPLFSQKIVHSKQLNVYKHVVEQYIKYCHPKLKWMYGKVRIDEKCYSGWKHLKLNHHIN
jgi:hypothetical protein